MWASALAYSWLFSLFPFLIFVLTLMPYLPGRLKEGAENRLHVAVMELPPKAAETVWSSLAPMVNRLLHQPPRGLLSTGLVIMLWAASSGMSMTMQAMDKCWGATECRPYYNSGRGDPAHGHRSSANSRGTNPDSHRHDRHPMGHGKYPAGRGFCGNPLYCRSRVLCVCSVADRSLCGGTDSDVFRDGPHLSFWAQRSPTIFFADSGRDIHYCCLADSGRGVSVLRQTF